jgi:hypothetical protein
VIPAETNSAPDRAAAAEFPATLGTREKLSTFIVGYGVGIGIPLILGIVFSTAFHQTAALLFPLVFASVLLLCYLLHPTGFVVTAKEITVVRHLMPYAVALNRLESIACPASRPEGFTIGLLRVVGIYGTFGIFWNRGWGVYRVFVTDHSKQVELALTGGSHVIVSPADPAAFVAAVRNSASRAGVALKPGGT